VRIALVSTALAAVLSVGCTSSTRPEVRAAVLHTAYSLKSADKSCSEVGQTLSDSGSSQAAIQLLEQCANAYDSGRSGLIAAEKVIDAKGELDAGKVACAMRVSVSALKDIVKAVSVYVKLPEPVTDGIERGDWLLSLMGGSCD